MLNILSSTVCLFNESTKVIEVIHFYSFFEALFDLMVEVIRRHKLLFETRRLLLLLLLLCPVSKYLSSYKSPVISSLFAIYSNNRRVIPYQLNQFLICSQVTNIDLANFLTKYSIVTLRPQPSL